jgi:hypothetical protein
MKILVPLNKQYLPNGEIFEIEQYILPAYFLKPGTNIRNILTLEWNFIALSNKGRMVRFSSAESFKDDKLDRFSFQEVQKLITNSFQNYQQKFVGKMKLEGLPLETKYTVGEKETIVIMYLLNPRRVNFVVAKNFTITPPHQKVISRIGEFLSVVLKDILPEIIKANTFIEYRADKDSKEGFILEVLTDDDISRKRVKTKIEMALNDWKGLN